MELGLVKLCTEGLLCVFNIADEADDCVFGVLKELSGELKLVSRVVSTVVAIDGESRATYTDAFGSTRNNICWHDV